MKRFLKFFIFVLTLTMFIPFSQYSISKAITKSKDVISSQNTENKDTNVKNKKSASTKTNISPQKNLKNNKVTQNSPKKESSSSSEKNSSKNISNESSTYIAPNNENKIEEKEITPSDWKISVNEQPQNENFSSIQNSIPFKDSINDGHIFLIIGIILVLISGIGLIFFTILIVKKNKKQ